MKLEERILHTKRTEENDWHIPRVGHYHASQIWNICEGKLKPEDYFKPKELDDKSIFNFFIGSMYHDAIQKLYPKNKREIECRIDLGDKAQIIGRCDLNLEFPVELKTCSNFPKTPYPSHVYQLNCYLHSLGKKKGFLTYIRKDAQEIVTKDFPIEYDSELMEDIIKKTLEFHNRLKLIK